MPTTNLSPTERPPRRFQILSVEWLALATSALCAMLVYAKGLRVYVPDGRATLFSFEHYLAPLAGLLVLGMLTGSRFRLRRALVQLRLMLSLAAIVFWHFNLKLWAGLLNTERFDALYARIDVAQEGCVEFLKAFGFFLGHWLFNWPTAYHDAFVAMFVAALLVHSWVSVYALERLVTAIGLVLLFGGLAYVIAPAWGPFVYQPTMNPAQSAMMEFQSRFVNSAGAIFHGNNFIMPLAAMPSLHVAHAWLLLQMMAQLSRWTLLATAPVAVYITGEALNSGWHYLIDIPAGLLIMGMAVSVLKRLPMLPPKGGTLRRVSTPVL